LLEKLIPNSETDFHLKVEIRPQPSAAGKGFFKWETVYYSLATRNHCSAKSTGPFEALQNSAEKDWYWKHRA